MSSEVVIDFAVEGPTDEAVARRLIQHAGGIPGRSYVTHGKANLKARIRGYNNATHYFPWLELVDLNSEGVCAPSLIQEWVGSPSPWLCARCGSMAACGRPEHCELSRRAAGFNPHFSGTGSRPQTTDYSSGSPVAQKRDSERLGSRSLRGSAGRRSIYFALDRVCGTSQGHSAGGDSRAQFTESHRVPQASRTPIRLRRILTPTGRSEFVNCSPPPGLKEVGFLREALFWCP